MAKFCTNCGATLDDDKKFCTECGASVNETPAGAAPPPPPPPQSAPQPQAAPVYAHTATATMPPPQSAYQPAAACGGDMAPAKGSKYEPITTGGYIGIMLLMCIPIVGQILMIVWALGGCRKINKRNLARASLILMLVMMLLTALLGFLAKKAVEAAVERAGIAEQIDALRDEKTGEIDLNALSGLLGENPGLSGLLGENSKLGDLSELAGMLEQFQNLDAGEMESLMQQMEQMQGG
ncbi:MAG: zinc ribbon domain-containing protein [Clostridia bacterium]|nr:zinc ribbon domain-containing protein [Clostridia bacterium]